MDLTVRYSAPLIPSVCGEEGLRGHEEHLHLLGELVAGVLPVIKF